MSLLDILDYRQHERHVQRKDIGTYIRADALSKFNLIADANTCKREFYDFVITKEVDEMFARITKNNTWKHFAVKES